MGRQGGLRSLDAILGLAAVIASVDMTCFAQPTSSLLGFMPAAEMNMASISFQPTNFTLVNPFPICPIPLCVAPPLGCQYVSSPEVDKQGCPLFPCGVLECNCPPCPNPGPICQLVPFDVASAATNAQSFEKSAEPCLLCPITCCPLPLCAAPPLGCFYEPSNEVGPDGCPAFPCGVLNCPCVLPLCAPPSPGCFIQFSSGEVDQFNCPIGPFCVEICPNVTFSFGEPEFVSGEISVPLLYTSFDPIFGFQFEFSDAIPTGYVSGEVAAADFQFVAGTDITLGFNVQSQSVPATSTSQLFVNLIFSLDDLEETFCINESSVIAGALGVSLDYIFANGLNCIDLVINCPLAGTGDVVPDNQISILDVTVLIQAVLNGPPTEDPCFIPTADVDQDGIVSVSDVVALVAILLG